MEKQPLLVNALENVKTFQETLINLEKPSSGDDDGMASFKFGSIYLMRHEFYLKFCCEFCGKQHGNLEDFIRDSLKHIIEETWEMNSNILLEKALDPRSKEECVLEDDKILVEDIKPTISSQNEVSNETTFIDEIFIKEEPCCDSDRSTMEPDIDELGIEVCEVNGRIFEGIHDADDQLAIEEPQEMNRTRRTTVRKRSNLVKQLEESKSRTSATIHDRDELVMELVERNSRVSTKFPDENDQVSLVSKKTPDSKPERKEKEVLVKISKKSKSEPFTAKDLYSIGFDLESATNVIGVSPDKRMEISYNPESLENQSDHDIGLESKNSSESDDNFEIRIDDNFKFLECNLSYNSKSALSLHNRKNHSTERLKLKQLTEEMKNEKKILMEETLRNLEYKCPFCIKKYNRKSSLRNHLQQIHTQPEDNENSEKDVLKKFVDPKDLICPFCNKQTTSIFSLRAHKYRHHPSYKVKRKMDLEYRKRQKQLSKDGIVDIDIDNDDSDVEMNAAMFDLSVCSFCEKTFETQTLLKQHVRRCHSKKKQNVRHSCDMCDATFRDKSNLKIHRFRHLGIKPHGCKYCEKYFTTTTERKTHELSHTKLKSYICELCTQGFCSSSMLKIHKRRHNNERPYSCKICHKSFYTGKELNKHLVSHSGQRPYKCNECNKAFFRKECLKQHKKLHSNEYPYHCQYCNRSFQQLAGLYSHVRTVHKDLLLLNSDNMLD